MVIRGSERDLIDASNLRTKTVGGRRAKTPSPHSPLGPSVARSALRRIQDAFVRLDAMQRLDAVDGGQGRAPSGVGERVRARRARWRRRQAGRIQERGGIFALGDEQHAAPE